jgi:hypothetical protein
MTHNFFDLLVLLGALQGFVVSALLFLIKKKILSQKLMGFLILLISLACLKVYLINQDWFQNNEAFQIAHAVFPLILFMPIGPLIFFYTRSVLDADFKISKKAMVSFLPHHFGPRSKNCSNHFYCWINAWHSKVEQSWMGQFYRSIQHLFRHPQMDLNDHIPMAGFQIFEN